MTFKKSDVIFVKARQFKSKNGNDIAFLTIADSETYENFESMPAKGFNYSTLVPGTHYDCEIDCDSRYTNMTLYPLSGKKEKF